MIIQHDTNFEINTFKSPNKYLINFLLVTHGHKSQIV